MISSLGVRARRNHFNLEPSTFNEILAFYHVPHDCVLGLIKTFLASIMIQNTHSEYDVILGFGARGIHVNSRPVIVYEVFLFYIF